MNNTTFNIPKNIIPQFCDRCGAKHNPTDMEVINSEDMQVTAKIDCHSCKATYLMHITMPMDGVVSGRKSLFKTDLSQGEVKKFTGVTSIETEEILDSFIAMKKVKSFSDLDNLLSNSDEFSD
jgi:DNA-directed RNA polymerase subunit RPC12/RpoP